MQAGKGKGKRKKEYGREGWREGLYTDADEN